MGTIHINLLAALVAGIINMVVGAIWYAPAVFGKTWARELGMKENAPMSANMAQAYGITFIGALIMGYVLALVLGYTGASTTSEGIMMGLWLWLGFAVTIPLNDVVFGKKSWTLYSLNVGYYLVVLVINGWLLTMWK